MAVSEAHKRASYKYNSSRDSITIRPEKEDGAKLRMAAATAGQSIQKFVMQACRERMARDSAAAADEPVSSAGAAQQCGAVSIPSDALEAVRTAAEAAGMTVDAWIVQAIKDKL